MKIPFGRPILGEEERAAVLKVMAGPQLVHGPTAKQFEADFSSFTGGYATSVSSCTTGLHLAYVHLGVGPGDEVIVPAQTHVATAHVVAHTGAKPVFVDCDPETGNVSAERIAKALTPRTKAISVVHYLGLPVDMAPIMDLARSRNLFVVEDAALSLGATYNGVHTGLIGDAGCFSFYPVKHITTAEGGMFLSRHEDLIRRIERLKSFGYDKQVGERTVPGHYDVNLLGYNYRLSEIACAIGVEQMKKLPRFIEQRAQNYAALKAALADVAEIRILASDGDALRKGSYYCLAIVLDDSIATKRRQIIGAINGKGVGTSIYYPVPVPLTTLYKSDTANVPDAFPNASRISYQSIALPVGPHLNTDDMKTIAQALKAAILENRS